MTTIYVPRLIESAEQAEALPPRTPVLMGPFVAHRPHADKGWVVTDAGGEYSSEELVAAHSHLTPTALVPIEAEEEFSAENSYGGRDLTSSLAAAQIDAELHGTAAQSRLVTPWSTPSTEELGGAALAEGGGPR